MIVTLVNATLSCFADGPLLLRPVLLLLIGRHGG